MRACASWTKPQRQSCAAADCCRCLLPSRLLWRSPPGHGRLLQPPPCSCFCRWGNVTPAMVCACVNADKEEQGSGALGIPLRKACRLGQRHQQPPLLFLIDVLDLLVLHPGAGANAALSAVKPQ